MASPDTNAAHPAALRTLTELVRSVASAADEEGVLAAVAEALKEAFGYERIALFLAVPEAGLVLRTLAGSFPTDVSTGIAIPPGEGLVGLAFAKGASMISGDTASDDRYREVPGLPCRSEVAVPIRIAAEAEGVLDVQSERVGAFDAPDVDLLESVADLVGVAVAKSRLLARWRTAVETRDHFLSSVSHEFRTPLTSIRSFAEILIAHGTEEAETTREFLSIIHEESMRLTRLVNDLLDLSKMQAGRMEWGFATNQLSEAVRRATATAASIAALKRVEIEVLEVAPIEPFVFDLDKIIQVLVNLVSNAIKFSPDGEKVTVLTEPREGGAMVAVRDRGPGIEPEDRGRIFERFEQVGGMADDPPGTGLGLSISQEIVHAHGGQIRVEAASDGGSEFSFVLPAREEENVYEVGGRSEPPRPERRVPLEAREATERPILVVEDDRSFRRFLVLELGRAGYRPIEAEDGLDGIRKARATDPALLVLDLKLPKLTGRDVLAVLASDPATRDIPVLVLTALDEKEAAGRPGVSKTLRKPLDSSELISAVNEILTNTESYFFSAAAATEIYTDPY
ncbi:MAG: ATP-binding protein [Planctomycetota bacterium]|jgi:signal transduction histidine kinase/ActR/RegA family two-component response regulator